MNNMFIMPNLPDTFITSAIVSSEISKRIEYSLEELGIKPIKVKGNMNCDKAIVNHPDIYIMHLSQNRVIAYKNICSVEEGVQLFESLEFSMNNGQKITYPNDAGLNAVMLGRRLICNKKTVDREIYNSALSLDYEIININQGYTKCNICVVDENSIITEDYGIAKKCRKHGIDVLLLEHRAINLRTYKYGFIGGATGKLSSDKLAFYGNLKLHPEYKRVYAFLSQRDIEAVSLSDELLYDYGSLLPLF